MKTRPEYVKCGCTVPLSEAKEHLDVRIRRLQYINDDSEYDCECTICDYYYYIDADQMDEHYDLKTMNTIW